MDTHEKKILIIVGIVFLLLNIINFRTLLTGDSQAHLYVAWSLATEGNYFLTEFEDELVLEDGTLPYLATRRDDDQIRSIFNFFPGTLLAPFVVPFRSTDLTLSTVGLIGKFVASLFTIGAGLFLYAASRIRFGINVSLLALIAFWFASPLWPTSVDYLQHHPLVFFKCVFLYLLFRSQQKPITLPTAIAASAALCCAFLSRYQTVPGCVAFGLLYIYFNREHRKQLLAFVITGLLFAGYFFTFNTIMNGGPLNTGIELPPWMRIMVPPLDWIVGIWLNPSKGVLIHSPWVLLALIWFWKRSALGLIEGVLLFSTICACALYVSFTGWYGGWCWGYRYMMDCLPEMILLAFGALHFVFNDLFKIITGVLIAFGFIVQTIGALTYDGTWHQRHDLGMMPDQQWLWQVENSQPLYGIKRGQIYLMSTPVSLGWNAYQVNGVYGVERWGETSVRWASKNTKFYYIARTKDPKLLLFTNRETATVVELVLDGNLSGTYALNPNEWTLIPIELDFQEAATIEITADREHNESGGNARDLAFALRAEDVMGDE